MPRPASLSPRTRLAAAVALAALAVALTATRADAHGWLMEPVPRGGGGTGSGNASTRGPCGKDGPTTVTAELQAGQPFTIQYKRANRHGASGPNVEVRLSYVAAQRDGAPTAADFDEQTEGVHLLNGALPMSVTESGPQNAELTAPTTVGAAVLQWKWQPRTNGQNAGGAWFDCAYVTVAQSVDPACVDDPCDENAACSGETEAQCDCNVGYFGDGRTCTPLPADEEVQLTLKVEASSVSQDEFTAFLADLLGVDEGRILFDRTEEFTVTQEDEEGASTTETYTTVYFFIGADPESGASGRVQADDLVRLVRNGDSRLGERSVATVRVGDSSEGFGSAPPDLSGTSSAKIFGASFGATLSIVLVAAAGAVYYQRRRTADEKVAKPAYVPEYYHQNKGASIGGGPAPALPADPQPQADDEEAAAAAAPEQVDADGVGVGGPEGGAWERHTTDEGVPYFYNPQTGESRWE